MLKEFKADEGNVWKCIKDGQVLNEILILGAFDKIENYEQILKPVEVELDE